VIFARQPGVWLDRAFSPSRSGGSAGDEPVEPTRSLRLQGSVPKCEHAQPKASSRVIRRGALPGEENRTCSGRGFAPATTCTNSSQEPRPFITLLGRTVACPVPVSPSDGSGCVLPGLHQAAFPGLSKPVPDAEARYSRERRLRMDRFGRQLRTACPGWTGEGNVAARVMDSRKDDR